MGKLHFAKLVLIYLFCRCLSAVPVLLTQLSLLLLLNAQCPHCKKLAPTWMQLADAWNKDESEVLVAQVNCDDISSLTANSNNSLCLRHGVAVPFIKYGNPASIASRSDLKLYGGNQTFNDLNALIKEELLVNNQDEKNDSLAKESTT